MKLATITTIHGTAAQPQPVRVQPQPHASDTLHDVPCDHHPPVPAAPTCGRRTPKRSRPCPDRHNRRPMPWTRDLTARSPACCGNGRDHRDRHAFSTGTTPRLKTQNGHLPQGPQSAILANYRGFMTSWPFVAASICPHDPVNTAPALTYLFNHDLLTRTVRTMKTSPPRANSYDGRADLCASFHRQETNWGRRRTT